MDEWDIAHSRLRSISAAEIKTFWDRYIAIRQGAVIERGSLYSRWRYVSHDLVISLYLTNRSVGLFVRGGRGEGYNTTKNRLSAYEPELGTALDAGLNDAPGCCYLGRLTLPVTDHASWPRGHYWLEEREEFYHRVLTEIVVRAER